MDGDVRSHHLTREDTHKMNGNGSAYMGKPHPASARKPKSSRSPDRTAAIPNAACNETTEETKEQTKKILEEFFKKNLESKSAVESTRKYAKKWQHLGKDKSSTSPRNDRVLHNDPVIPVLQPLKTDKDDRKLYDLMRGRYNNPGRQVSSASIASTESADSAQGFQRTKSFVKAQRHSVVTEIENQHKIPTRRNSEDVSSPQHTDSVACSESRAHETTGSPIVHSRASSDPVMVRNAIVDKKKHTKKEGKEKKSWIKKISSFTRKKDSHKSKGSYKSSSEDFDNYGFDSNKAKSSSQKTLSREESVVSRRRTPSPPPSPKRTPKLFRRISKKRKEVEKSSSTSPIRSQSFDAVEGVITQGNEKTNSLPKGVHFSTHDTHSGLKKHPGGTKHHEQGSSQTPESQRKNKKKDPQRPNTLDIPKKKTKLSTRIRNFFFYSSPSSSSLSSSEPDLSHTMARDFIDGDQGDDQRLTQSDGWRRGVQYSHSDSKPSVSNVRNSYHHGQSKSMSDMDSQDKSLHEIAEALRLIVERLHQNHQYSGPSGRTQTPDSYQHDRRITDNHTHAVSRSKSVQPSLSMKAYLNLEKAKARKSEYVHHDRSDRITREDVQSHHSPEQKRSQKWVDRAASESSRLHSSHVRISSELDRSANNKISSQHSSKKPKQSTVQLDIGRTSRSPLRPNVHMSIPEEDHNSLPHSDVICETSVVESHIDRTVTVSSPTLRSTTHIHIDRFTTVQTDALPAGSGSHERGDCDDDFSSGFADIDDTDETTQDTVTGEAEQEVAAVAPPHVRGRSATEPAIFNHLDSELDNDFEEQGAVGGEDTNSMDDDKLVDALVKALSKKGDEIAIDGQLERKIGRVAQEWTEEQFKAALRKAISRVFTNVDGYKNRDIVELAVIFDLCDVFRRLTVGGAIQRFCSSLINQIVTSGGGWLSVKGYLPETIDEVSNLEDDNNDDDVPSTSYQKRMDESHHDELD